MQYYNNDLVIELQNKITELENNLNDSFKNGFILGWNDRDCLEDNDLELTAEESCSEFLFKTMGDYE